MDKRRVGVRGIIYKDGLILGVKHKSKDGTPKDWWAIPGGGLDPHESLEDGLRREMKEEIGVRVDIGRLLFIQQFKSTRPDRDEELEFFFLIENVDDFNDIDFSKTSHGLEELAECRFIDPKKEKILPKFIGEITTEGFLENIQPVLLANELHS